MQKRYWGLIVFVGSALAVTLGNSSLFVKTAPGATQILAHRGVHQTFPQDELTSETCTAEHIVTPTHFFIENTIDSMAAAFEYGADMVELDVHLTTDGKFAVFHDWTLDCRTNGSGVTRHSTMAKLKQLDIGYGYAADGGQSFPFRGKFVGAMPELSEVFDRFPDEAFMINFKSRDVQEAHAMIAMLEATKSAPHLAFTGSERILSVLRQGGVRGQMMSREMAMICLKSYLKTGWLGRVSPACENSFVPVPSNYRGFVWGWPHRFARRLGQSGSSILLIGPMAGQHSTGIDDNVAAQAIPENFQGWVSTNRIELIGPAIKTAK